MPKEKKLKLKKKSAGNSSINNNDIRIIISCYHIGKKKSSSSDENLPSKSKSSTISVESQDKAPRIEKPKVK